MASVLSPVSFAPTPMPAPPTAVQAAAAAILSGVQALFKHNVSERQRLYNLFWNNSGRGCTPQALAAQIGDQLVSVFECDAALVAFLQAQAAAANPPVPLPAGATAGIPAGYGFTPDANGDGAGVLTYTAPTPAPVPTPTPTPA